MNFLHGEVPFFVLFQFGNAALVFDDPVINDISPICMFEGKFGVLLGEKDGHSCLQSAQYLSFIVSLKFLLLSHLHQYFFIQLYHFHCMKKFNI